MSFVDVRWTWLLAGGVLMLAVGCEAQPSAPQSEPEVPVAGPAVEPEAAAEETAPEGQSEPEAAPETESTAVPEEASAGREVTLQILDWDATQKLVDKHRGKVVVMDLWSTYCPPCIAEFPHLVKLHREYGDQVECISVSLDYDGLDDTPVEGYREKVLRFLKKQNATFTNVLLSTDAETLFNKHIEHNSMPVVYVFDQDGKRVAAFPDLQGDPEKFNYADFVTPLVERLLAER